MSKLYPCNRYIANLVGSCCVLGILLLAGWNKWWLYCVCFQMYFCVNFHSSDRVSTCTHCNTTQLLCLCALDRPLSLLCRSFLLFHFLKVKKMKRIFICCDILLNTLLSIRKTLDAQPCKFNNRITIRLSSWRWFFFFKFMFFFTVFQLNQDTSIIFFVR